MVTADATGMLLSNLTAVNITNVNFTVQEATAVLQPLLILIGGIVIYAWFIFKFYRFLARKDIFAFEIGRAKENRHPLFAGAIGGILYVVKYILLFPLFVFFWFLMIVLFITVISSRPFSHILLASMGLVAATRVCAYYDEDLSKDLAKMIPFALLGIFIIDVKLISFLQFTEIIQQLFLAWKNVLYYLLLAIALEIILRIVTGVASLFKH